MIARRCCASLLVWGLFVSGCARFEKHPPRSTAVLQQVSLGLCEDYPEESRSLRAARRDLSVVQTNGLSVLRIAFGWDAMEPEPGRYDWSFWDEFVRMATDEYGVELIPYVCYTPNWAASVQGPDSWRQPPADPRHYARFVERLVARYKDRIHSWEIWNEPDNPHYWLGTLQEFGELLQAGGEAVKRTDPGAKVVLGGLAWNLGFLAGLLTNSAWMAPVDVVNLHNYYETWSGDSLEELTEYIGQARDILVRSGRDRPLWLAEFGYSSFRQNGFVSGQFQPQYLHEHTPWFQDDALFRAHTLLLATGQVELLAWYRINDLPGHQEVIGDVNNRHLGVLDMAGHAKPALKALNWVQQLFGDGYVCIDEDVRVTRNADSEAEVHAFRVGGNRIIITAWLKTVVAGTRNDPTARSVDSRSESLAVELPFRPPEPVRIYDECGTMLGVLPAKTVLSFQLAGPSTLVFVISKPPGVVGRF